MKYFLSLFLVALASVLFTGCRSASIQPVETHTYATSKATVEQAIIDGCRERGWSPRKVKDGEIEAVLNVRSHTAIVTIPYSADGYKILYKDSTNLKYDPADKTIHSNFVNWVRNLDQSISRRLIKAEATPTGSSVS